MKTLAGEKRGLKGQMGADDGIRLAFWKKKP